MCAIPLAAANPIQIENARAGTGEWRLFSEAVNGEVEGYASATSVNQGESISLYVSSTAPQYKIDIFRLGWYGGAGGRRVADPVIRTGFQQAVPTPDPVTGMIECNWIDPYTITIPGTWLSGVYLAKLTALGLPSEKNKYILFVVREDSRTANHNFQITVTTAQAYNSWGGRSLYGSNPSRKVSFNRPYTDGSGTGIFLWRWEYNALRFLEREGYDLLYTTNIDTHRRGHLLLNAKSFLSIGHDEYWSWEMRENLESALSNGVNLGFFSANSVYWQVRFEPSPISGVQDRTMVGYKAAALMSDPYALDSDPSNDNRITTQFRLAPVNRPESALLGVQYIYYPVDTDIVIDDVTSQPWVFAESGLTTGSKLSGLLGYEVDAMNQHTPPGTVRLGNSPFVDTANNTQYSHMTVYDAGMGWVFSTGSIQWAWGLDDWNGHNHPNAPVSAGAQQITRNVLRKFAGNDARADCQITISPASTSVGAAPGGGSITLTTASHCGWTIASSANWLTLISAASGTGSTTITYQYSSNAGAPARVATLTVGDKTFSVLQADGCTYAYSPPSHSIGATGGEVTFTIDTTTVCSWTAMTQEPWLQVTSAGSGLGDANVTVAVDPNEGPSRDAGVYLNGSYFNVHQSGGCAYSAQPGSVAMPASGGEGQVEITTNSACFWNSSTTASWIVLTSGADGQGSGITTYTVQPNTTGAERVAIIVAAGVSVTVRQSGTNCLYEVSPLWVSHNSGAATGTITVNSACAFEAAVESGSHFITIAATTASTITYSVAQNNGATARTGTIRVSGRGVNITQNGSGQAIFGLTATAASTSTASLSWSPVTGATAYEVYRSSNGSSLGLVTSTSGTSHTDSGLAANRTYLYRIRAVGASGALAFSNLDPATTIVFSDPTIVDRVTRIRAVHILQLRTAVNAMRASGLLPSQTFSDPSLSGGPIRAVHVAQLRGALAAARLAMGLPAVSFADPSFSVIRASHINDLRSGVQ
jgi:hypothetical protein